MILLDTHTFIWWSSDRSQLSGTALQLLEHHYSDLFISVVTAWEIAILHKKNRLDLPLPPREFVEKAVKHYDIHELPLRREISFAAVELPDIHQDPFDRILIAEAISSHLRLVTKDKLIQKYPDLSSIW